MAVMNEKINENTEQIDVANERMDNFEAQLTEIKETFTAQMTQMQKSFNKTLAERDAEIARLKGEKEKPKEFAFEKIGVSE